jgi:hypothetical protein
MPLTRVLIYQEKVIVAEGIFRYLLFELWRNKTMLNTELMEPDMSIRLQFDHQKEELMSEFTGIHREVLKDGTIKHVLVRDKSGHEQAKAAKDYISEGIQPDLDDLPEVSAGSEYPKTGKGNG